MLTLYNNKKKEYNAFANAKVATKEATNEKIVKTYPICPGTKCSPLYAIAVMLSVVFIYLFEIKI